MKTTNILKPHYSLKVETQRKLKKLAEKLIYETRKEVLNEYKKQYDLLSSEEKRYINTGQFQDKINHIEREKRKDFIKKSSLIFLTLYNHTSKYDKSFLKNYNKELVFKDNNILKNLKKAFILENSNLSNSLFNRYFTNIKNIIFGGIRNNNDFSDVEQDFEKENENLLKRQKRIVEDQVNKINNQLTIEFAKEHGITQAYWIHDHPKEPRPSHIKAHMKIFDLKEGLLIDDEYIMPAEKPNCKCSLKLILNEL